MAALAGAEIFVTLQRQVVERPRSSFELFEKCNKFCIKLKLCNKLESMKNKVQTHNW